MSYNAYSTINRIATNNTRLPVSYTYTNASNNNTAYRILLCKNTGKYNIILDNEKKIGYVCLGGGAAGIKNTTISGTAYTGYGGGAGAINASSISSSAITLSTNMKYIINVGRGGYGTSTTIALTNETPATASSISTLVTSNPGLPNGSAQAGTNNGSPANSGIGGASTLGNGPGNGGDGVSLTITDINLSGRIGGGGGGAVYGTGTNVTSNGGKGGNGSGGGGASNAAIGGIPDGTGVVTFSTDSGTVTFGGVGSAGVSYAGTNPPGNGGSAAANTGAGGGAPFSNGESTGGSGVVLIYYQINETGTGYTKFFSGIYTILLYRTTGPFTLTLDKTTKIGYVCVGGGAGGGLMTQRGGGGGAVNYASYSSSSNNATLTKDTLYTITVGAGSTNNRASEFNLIPGDPSSISSIITSYGGNNTAIARSGSSDGISNASGVGGQGSTDSGPLVAESGTGGVYISITDIGLTGTVAGAGGGSTNKNNVVFAPYASAGDGINGGGGGCNYSYSGVYIGSGSSATVTFAAPNGSRTFTGTGGNGQQGGEVNGGSGGANTGAGGGGYIGNGSSPSSTGGSGFVLIYYPT